MSVLAAALILVGASCTRARYSTTAELMNSDSRSTDISYSNLNAAQPPVQPPAAEQPVVEQPAAGPAVPGSAAPPPSSRAPRPTSFPGILPDKELSNKEAVITTDEGIIVFRILGDEGPRAASNFIALARSGFYDGLTFHRVVPGFVVQGGDPLGNGTGGPGYKFEDDPVKTLDYQPGIVAMANSGPDTNGSQFFIVTDYQPTLPKAYSIFGLVTRGLDVVRRISVGDVMHSVVIQDVKPDVK